MSMIADGRSRPTLPHTTRHSRLANGLGTACATFAVGLLATSTASAAPTKVTEMFSTTGVEQSFTVPTGVSHVRVRAVGEAGQAGNGLDEFNNFTMGGDGAVVAGELPVTAGEVLYVEVGAGSFGGGGEPGIGAGAGGAASDVRAISASEPDTLESRLLVAGGGGGGGGIWQAASGGNGGNAGSPGGTAIEGETFGGDNTSGSNGGSTGTLTGGGAGGQSCEDPGPWWGDEGSLGVGGNGGDEGENPETGGGGGGGGYWGGGGGEGQCIFADAPSGGGGGGGGGSSYTSEEAGSVSFGLASSTTPPSVAISYQTPATATPSSSAVEFAGTQPLTTLSAPQTVTLTNSGGNPLAIDSVHIAGSEPALGTDHPENFLLDSSDCLGAVAFKASCQITVRFSPQATGASTATLHIEGDMGAGATVIALSGTGGTLPQGEPGASGAQGSAGAQGAQGQTGSDGAAGQTGARGQAGEPGAQGPTGPQGATGPRGEQGPRGLTATLICHPRQLHGRYKEACYVSVKSPPATAASASLRRAGVVYASGPVGRSKSSGHLLLQASRNVPAGRYTLVLRSAAGVSRRAVTIG